MWKFEWFKGQVQSRWDTTGYNKQIFTQRRAKKLDSSGNEAIALLPLPSSWLVGKLLSHRTQLRPLHCSQLE